MGKLYICGTPIGNMEDVSIRLLKTLRKVDIIACEDTRHTLKLLNRYKIKNKLVSYHEYSSPDKEEYLLEEIINDKNIALVTDAGMPSISDPGQGLVKKAIDRGVDIEVIPGPSAAITAMAISGMASDSFIFEGFLPNKKGKRREVLEKLAGETRTIILYEAPHRLLATLEDIADIMGPERKIAVARELTKVHEEIQRGQVADIKDYFTQHPPRGEITLLIASPDQVIPQVDLDQIMDEIDELIRKGKNKKEAFKMKAQEYQLKKSIIYNYYVEKNR